MSRYSVLIRLSEWHPILAPYGRCWLHPTLPASGPGWVYEIKHDGFRMMVRREAVGVRLLTRRGNDWTHREALLGAVRHPRTKKPFENTWTVVLTWRGLELGHRGADSAPPPGQTVRCNAPTGGPPNKTPL
jgi:hypothetical protein